MPPSLVCDVPVCFLGHIWLFGMAPPCQMSDKPLSPASPSDLALGHSLGGRKGNVKEVSIRMS